MLPKELQTAINHMSPDNRRVAEAIVIFYEDYYGRKLVQMESRLKELEDQLAKNSRNSNKPPSSDTFNKPAPKSLRKKTGRKPGGQKGHDGTTLKMVDCPDVQVTHRVEECEVCKKHLGNEVAGQIERRQVYDLPDLKFLVTEHQAEIKQCSCGHVNRAVFPAAVKSRVQYGTNIKSLVVYMQDYQLLPYKRMEAFVADLFGHKMSSGTFSNFRKEAFEALSGFEDGLKAVLAKAKVAGFDETGLRVNSKGMWLHSCSTSKQTYYEVHARRGREAMDAIGILPKFKGVAVHDFWKAYYHYACDHAVCAAHLLRELTFIKECCKQTWATDFISFFLQMKTARERAIAQGKSSLSKPTLQWYRNSYDDLIKRGLAVNPIKVPPEKTKGRIKKTKARNLLERFRDYHEDILRFFHDFDVPFDNNLSERDIRMTKVKQKISGCFRTFTGARYFARTRSFVSTAQKQHVSILDALKDLFGDNQIHLQLVGAAE